MCVRACVFSLMCLCDLSAIYCLMMYDACLFVCFCLCLCVCVCV